MYFNIFYILTQQNVYRIEVTNIGTTECTCDQS